MSKKPFKIIPERDVGKTEVLYKGAEKHLEQLKKAFPNIKSSEVYPSFEENFKFTMFFYNTKEGFLNKLYKRCKDNLPRLDQRSSTAIPIGKILTWILVGGIGILIAVFALGLISTIREALNLVK